MKFVLKGCGTVREHQLKQATKNLGYVKLQVAMLRACGVSAGLALEFHSAFRGNLNSVSDQVPPDCSSFCIRNFLKEGSLHRVCFLTPDMVSRDRSTQFLSLLNLYALQSDPTVIHLQRSMVKYSPLPKYDSLGTFGAKGFLCWELTPVLETIKFLYWCSLCVPITTEFWALVTSVPGLAKALLK